MIAAEFSALEQSFQKLVGLMAQERSQNPSTSLPSSGPSSPGTQHMSSRGARDLGSPPGLPSWDEDRIKCIERTNHQSFATLREVRAERDSWRDRATRAERELAATKKLLREMRAHSAFLETQVHGGSGGKVQPPEEGGCAGVAARA